MLAKKTIRKKRLVSLKRLGTGGLSGLSRQAARGQSLIAKQVLGMKQYSSLFTKILSLSWRFVAAFLFVFYLITGIGPLDFCFKSIDALGSLSDPKIQTIAFYAGDSKPDIASDDYQLGWWSDDKSIGAPNVNSTGGLFLFSPDNSSFYSGGGYSLILDNFNPGEKIINEEAPSENIEATDDEPASAAEVLNSENAIDEVVSDDATDGDAKEETTEEQQVEIIAPEDETGEDINDNEIENKNAESEVIVVEEDSEDTVEIGAGEDEAEVMIIDEGDSRPEAGGDLSFLDKIINYFNKKEAIAGDGDAITSMDLMFGKFHSARIKISLAFGSNKKSDELLGGESIGIGDLEEASLSEIEGADEAIRPEEETGAEELGGFSGEEILNETESQAIEEEQGEEIIKEENAEPLSMIRNFFNAKEAAAGEDDARLVVWYSFDDLSATSGDIMWRELDTVYDDNFSNALNGGYLSYEAPFVNGWQDLANLKIKVEGLSQGKSEFVVYLDSVWVEADYEADKSKTESGNKSIMEMLSYQLDFKINEEGELRFKYNKDKSLMDSISESFGFSNYWSDVDLKIEITDSDDNVVDLPLTIFFEENGEFSIKLPEFPRHFKPGQYKIKFYIEDKSSGKSEFINFEQDFSWGVLALNIDKSMYGANDDSAFLQMGVLDNEGHTVCDAELYLEIYSPDDGAAYLSTEDGSITKNPDCGMDNIIDSPDYFTHYMLYGAGQYEIRLFASTTNGLRETRETFEVKDEVAFDVERVAPTRINPIANYKMVLNIKANRDFSGNILEYLPEDFFLADQYAEIKNASSGKYILYNDSISSTSPRMEFSLSKTGDAQVAAWTNLNLSDGDEIRITYEFDAPNVSPEFYLLGPLQFTDTMTSDIVFEEARQWQIASDAVANIRATNGINFSWTNAASAFDSAGNNTYATKSILKRTGTSPESTLYLEMTASNASDLGGTINTVEIGVEGYVQNAAVTAYAAPYFDGSALGARYTVPSLGTTPNVDTVRYMDITNDASRPNYPSAWTWQEVIDLHARVYGGNSSNSTDYTMYVDMIHIRVDYTPNNAPTSTIVYAAQRPGLTGVIDMTISAGDLDGDNDVRAKLEYEAGTSCVFSPGLDPTLDETDASATSTYADAKIDNGSVYQIGSSTGWIETATGTNYVNFDWFGKTDLDNQEGDYCLRLTAFDGDDVQTIPATSTVLIDNKAPVQPGALTAAGTDKDSITLGFGATSSDANFSEYVIYWKAYDGINVDEGDTVFSSTSDSNLSDILFGGAATTSIGGLSEDAAYSFAIFAYDDYGHVSSSTRVDITTNKTPLAKFNSVAEKTDGTGVVDISTEVYDKNHDESMMKIEYEAGTSCLFGSSGDPSLDETQSNIYASLGIPKIENDNGYQIGTASGYIVTTASNTVAFDWFSATDLDDVEGDYCLRITANDQKDDQNVSATATVQIDNKNPSVPGDLANGGVSTSTVSLIFGTASTDANFKEYRIYYKEGTSGVTEGDTAHSSSTDANLGDRLFNSESATAISGLSANTDYVFNIWAYDYYGHKISATEVTLKTDAYITNDSLTFVNPESGNIAIADETTEWIFSAVVSDEEGWTSLADVDLRIQNSQDTAAPYDDLKFNWDQTSGVFSETGADSLGMAVISANSTSTCAVNTCTLDFRLIFNKNFSSSAADYSAELYSANDSLASDEDSFTDFYQVRMIRLEQIHYRWRNDDGGE